MTEITLAFLRHAKVPSHEGDMPITPDAQADIAAAADKLLAHGVGAESVQFLATRTNRSKQTAEALKGVICPSDKPVEAAWGLRNPDLYLAGQRVEMMSKPQAIAAQLSNPAIQPEDVLEHPFFHGFLNAPDRIGYWLHHKDPPGESAARVAHRVLKFAESFRIGHTGKLVIACVTHSPVMRALLVQGFGLPDDGEPDWVEAINLTVAESQMHFSYREHHGPVQF